MNLIITCPRHFEIETKEEIRKILTEFGDNNPKIFLSKLVGILTAKTSLDPFEIVHKTREKLREEPWSLRYIQRMIPIQKEISGNSNDIVEQSILLASSMKKIDKYRITIEKRHSEISSMDLISKIAEKIDNEVNLENPDVILLIEIIGNLCGISLLRKENILSVEKEKRSLSE